VQFSSGTNTPIRDNPGFRKTLIEQIDKKEGFLKGMKKGNEGWIASKKPLIFGNKSIDKFDIIMGNPPYNRNGVSRPDTRKNKKKNNEFNDAKQETIWNLFVLQAFSMLNKDGLILFIHPIGWLHDGEYDNIRDILLENQINNIRIYTKAQSKKVFGGRGEIAVAYYHLEKKISHKKTDIIGTNGKKETIQLNKNSLILLNDSTIINKCMKKTSFWKDNKNFKHTSVQCVEGKYKQIKGIYENGDIIVVKTHLEHKDQNLPKIIVSGATFPRIYYDKKGEFGATGTTVNYWIGDDKDLENIEDFLGTKLAAFLSTNLRYRQGFIEFKYFPDITLLSIDNITDKSLADVFEFTKEECEIINSTKYPDMKYTFKESSCSVKLKDEQNTDSEEESKGGSSRLTRKIRR
jgi:hypothetical protein